MECVVPWAGAGDQIPLRDELAEQGLGFSRPAAKVGLVAREHHPREHGCGQHDLGGELVHAGEDVALEVGPQIATLRDDAGDVAATDLRAVGQKAAAE